MDFPFVSDGCSGGMSAAWRCAFGTATPWEGCCVRHDVRYWAGGTAKERRAADDELFLGVRARGHPVIAALMWIAVRAGGVPWRPTGYRWGYGWRFMRFRLYTRLDDRSAAARNHELEALSRRG